MVYSLLTVLTAKYYCFDSNASNFFKQDEQILMCQGSCTPPLTHTLFPLKGTAQNSLKRRAPPPLPPPLQRITFLHSLIHSESQPTAR